MSQQANALYSALILTPTYHTDICFSLTAFDFDLYSIHLYIFIRRILVSKTPTKECSHIILIKMF